MRKLLIEYNGHPYCEVIKGSVPGHKRAALDRIEADFAEGIEIDGERIAEPDEDQRRDYVLQALLYALMEGRRDNVELMALYLARSWPALSDIQASDQGDEFEVRLGFE